MLIRKAYKYRLDPTAEQAAWLAVLCGHARFVWNHGLRYCLEQLEQGKKIPSAFELNKLITQWKKQDDLSWLKEAYTDNLQQKLKDLHSAWMRYFDKSLAAEKPRFKKKGKNQDAIRFVNFNKYCQLDAKRVKLPGKLGWLKFRESRQVQGVIKNCTVSLKSGHWYISFQVEQEVADPCHPSASAVGVDMGVARFVTLSDGSHLKPLNAFRKHEKRLAVEHRKLSRKVKFSANWKKQKAKVQNIHTRIANCRNDYLHKASTSISKNHAMIAIEDLRVSNMSKSAQGTEEQHGTNVKAKSGLNKSILDQGWHEFRRQLEYKQSWSGGMVVAVPAHHTSQTCPNCGHVSKENRQTQARFKCIECDYMNNADVVGALNVLERGHRLLACGESALVAQ
ncbi:RNA-guided endonuclease InsQ/TnpB family protein [Oceanimonas smirnovii]|uniref:RNA-guided endonuclease InsQ/TnpB family protein n=1 Tax=Oceanimonas smirnovii TaxID=264574 RepID=UPI003FD6B6EA